MTEIEKQNEKANFIFVLWSLDCPPCFKELEYLSIFVKQNNRPKLILVSTDGAEYTSEIQATLKQYHLHKEENWNFYNVPELLRSKIDLNWYGELPRSYYYQKDEERLTHSGPLNPEIMGKWLN
jgi:thiol-disulfide isomerase/thioredoxin